MQVAKPARRMWLVGILKSDWTAFWGLFHLEDGDRIFLRNISARWQIARCLNPGYLKLNIQPWNLEISREGQIRKAEDAIIPKSERRAKKKLQLLELLDLECRYGRRWEGMAPGWLRHRKTTTTTTTTTTKKTTTTTYVTKQCGRYSYDVRWQGDAGHLCISRIAREYCIMWMGRVC